MQACAEQQCYLYAGSGLGAQAGLPTWGELVLELVSSATSAGAISREMSKDYQQTLHHGLIDSVADSLVSFLHDRDPGLAARLLIDFFSPLYERDLPAVHRHLETVPFAGVIAG